MPHLCSRKAVYASLCSCGSPVPASVRVRAHNHLLGESGVTIFGAPALAAAHRRGFPGSLNGAPFVAPTDNNVLRRSLDAWFTQQGVHPLILAELEDSAVLKVFGQRGLGMFAAPTWGFGSCPRSACAAPIARGRKRD